MLTMSKCYNAECMFSKGWGFDCDCSDLCVGYTAYGEKLMEQGDV